MQKHSVLFVYVNFSSFVRTDYDILKTFAEVTKYEFSPGKGILNTALKCLKQMFFLLLNMRKFSMVYIWFADYHSFLPVLFAKIMGKKSYVVIGGYEVCRIKSLNYGALCSKFRGFFCINSMKWSTANITVSKYVDRKIKFIAPKSTRVLIHNSVGFAQLPINNIKKTDTVLTVGLINNSRTFFLKGIDTFIEIARKSPDYDFIIIGIDKKKLDFLLVNIPDNLSLYDKVPHEKLGEFYLKAKYYAQLSRSESFGLSVAEAMLHGCIPIVTNEGGLPELIGSTGFIVARDPETISRLIRNTDITSDMRFMAFDRIIKNYSLEKRKNKLLNLLNEAD